VGPPLPEGLRADPFGAFVVRWTATSLIGANGLTLFIAPTAFRRGRAQTRSPTCCAR
jgi:hypothetical protein